MLLRKWKTWRSTPTAARIAFVEAVVLLAAARIVVAVGLQLWGKRLVRPASAFTKMPSLETQREVRRAIFLATKNIPWSSLCLPNAIAAKWMLARRGYGSTIHLGVGQHATGDLHAHAWLEAGGAIVTGEREKHTVTQITRPSVSRAKY